MNGAFCTQCGTRLADTDKFCNSCGFARVADLRYAGFWIRLGAAVIDLIVCIAGIVLLVIGVVVIYYLVCRMLEIEPHGFGDSRILHSAVMYWTGLVGAMIYETLLIHSKWQATLGKKIVGIKVVNGVYERLSLMRSFLRYIAKGILPGCAGYIASYLAMIFPSHEDGLSTASLLINAVMILLWYGMLVFDKRKRAGHDRIALTYVVYK